jgi:hypothetical protein
LALALWNEADPILKERLFGLTGPEGNHGEDVKEYYFYLDNTPTHSSMKALYKYPRASFPYAELVAENRHRGRECSNTIRRWVGSSATRSRVTTPYQPTSTGNSATARLSVRSTTCTGGSNAVIRR